MIYKKVHLLYNFIYKEFPTVNNQLHSLEEYASKYAEKMLAYQACESISHKKFHALGGSVYALYPDIKINIADFIVAYQTICDYLDNLCDRAGIEDEKAFRQLHLAMTDAISIENEFSDYYRYYDYKNDGGYLQTLVAKCKEVIRKLPSYELIQEEVIWMASRYSELQSYKHIKKEFREEKLYSWAEEYVYKYEDLKINEFWSATGSTLGIFCLIALATDKDLNKENVIKVKEAYFPWINSFHIMLDYLIDREEDIKGNDLNFTEYYRDNIEMIERIKFLLYMSKIAANTLEHKDFHLLAIGGMLALYFSDNKVQNNENRKIIRNIMKDQRKDTYIMYKLCRLLRKLRYF